MVLQALSQLQTDTEVSQLFSWHAKLAGHSHSLREIMGPAGLDLLAAKKREEATHSASNGKGGSSALGKRPRGMLDDEDGDDPSGSGREGLSGQQRQYRTHRLETPSHPGAQSYSTSIPGMQQHCQSCKSRLCQLHTCILRRTSLPLILHSL